MDTIFTNYENNKISDSDILLLNVRIRYIKKEMINILFYWILASVNDRKNTRKLEKNNKSKIFAPT